MQDWWNLNNLSRVAELALKLIGIVAAIVALNVFSGLRARGAIFPTTDCRAPISEARLMKSYGQIGLEDPPRAVLQALDQQASQAAIPLASASGATLRLGCSQNLRAIEDLRRSSLPKKEQDKRLKLLRSIYPDVAPGLQHSVPEIAVNLAENPDLKTKDLAFALNAIETARYIQIIIMATNVGNATTSNVRIEPPEGFALIEASPKNEEIPPNYREFAEAANAKTVYAQLAYRDLKPKEEALFMLQTQTGATRGRARISQFVPKWENEQSVNVVPVMLFIGVLLLVIWLPAVIKDIRNPKSNNTTKGD